MIKNSVFAVEFGWDGWMGRRISAAVILIISLFCLCLSVPSVCISDFMAGLLLAQTIHILVVRIRMVVKKSCSSRSPWLVVV